MHEYRQWYMVPQRGNKRKKKCRKGEKIEDKKIYCRGQGRRKGKIN